MRFAIGAPIVAAAFVALGACGNDSELASNDYPERQAPVETPDYRFAPPATNPDLRDIPPPLTPSPGPGQSNDPSNPLATPPASPPPVAPMPAPESTPG